MNIKYSLIVILLFITLVSLGKTDQEKFSIVAERKSISNQINFLGFYTVTPMPRIPLLLRNVREKEPGDYFYSPAGADSMMLSEKEKNEIKGLLDGYIDSAYFDEFVIKNLAGYRYRLTSGSAERHEYHVRYTLGDTIFVISGWLGKFISFYKAVPNQPQYSLRQLKDEITSICPSFQNMGLDQIKQDSILFQYFREYIDSGKMLRVRNYNILEEISYDPKTEQSTSESLNLIEITKFIDKEVMP